jgi:hypothetical protein
MALVDVDDMGDADILDTRQMLVMIETAAAGGPRRVPFVITSQADDGDIDRVIRAALCTGTRRAHGQSNGGRGGFGQKIASVEHFLALPVGATRRLCSAARLGSLHYARASPLAPFRSLALAARPAASRGPDTCPPKHG